VATKPVGPQMELVGGALNQVVTPGGFSEGPSSRRWPRKISHDSRVDHIDAVMENQREVGLGMMGMRVALRFSHILTQTWSARLLTSRHVRVEASTQA